MKIHLRTFFKTKSQCFATYIISKLILYIYIYTKFVIFYGVYSVYFYGGASRIKHKIVFILQLQLSLFGNVKINQIKLL